MVRKKQKLLYLTIALPISSLTLYFGINMITGRRGLLTLINLKKRN